MIHGRSTYAVKGAYGIAFSSRFIQDPFDQIHLPSHKRLFCGNPLEFRIILYRVKLMIAGHQILVHDFENIDICLLIKINMCTNRILSVRIFR